MFKQILTRTLFVLVLLPLTAVPALAGVGQIVDDFKPLAGYVVMEMDGQYIIDLDADKGVRAGDIFAAVTKGEKIIHPVTGEVLGTLDQVRAQLRVSNVKSGYSYAVPLPGSAKLKPGAAIRRFQGIPATFWDYTGEGEPLFTELKAGLPALEWRSYKAAQEQKPERPQKVDGLEGLVFILTGKGLEVKDATYQPIRFYSRADLAREGVAIAVAAPAVTAPISTPDPGTTATGIVAAEKPAESRAGGIVQTASSAAETEGIWFGPEMTGEIVGLDVADLNGDGENDLAIAFPKKVLLGNMTGGRYVGKGFIEMKDLFRIVGVDLADLDGNGKPEIYISAVMHDISRDVEVISSMVVEEVDGQLMIVDDGIPYLLNRVDLPGEGTVIAAQRIDDKGERTYGGKVWRLVRKKNDFKRGEEIDYGTDRLTVHGFTPFRVNDESLVALLDINEDLEVYNPAGVRLWAGSDRMGGSQSYVVRQDPNAPRDQLHFFLKANLRTLDDDTVLVPLNEGSTRMFYKREFSKSQIAAMQWDGYALKEIWKTEPQGGYLADFRVADVDNDGKEEIVMGILFSQGGLLTEVQKRSALVVYELP